MSERSPPSPFSVPSTSGLPGLAPQGAGWGRWFLLAFGAVLLSWLPLLLLCAREPAVLHAFLDDWVLHARLWISVPVLILLQPLVASRVEPASRHLVESGLVPASEWARLERIHARMRRIRDARAVPLLLVLLALWASWLEPIYALPLWRAARLPELWFQSVSGPLLRFLLLLWVWRLAVWGLYMLRVSQLELRLLNTHPDGRGGLAILGEVLTSYVWLTFAISAPVAVQAKRVLGTPHGDLLSGYLLPLVVVAACCTLLIFGPLCAFSRKLRQAKRRDGFAFAALTGHQAEAFQQEWFASAPGDPRLLKAPDYSAVEDLQSTFQRAQGSKWVPFYFRSALAVAAGALWAAGPLLAIDHQLVEVLLKIFHALG